MNPQVTMHEAYGSSLTAGNEKFCISLIAEISSFLNSHDVGRLSPAAYDTAWVARIPSEKDPAKPMFPQCLQWLLDNQYSDGSWGNNPDASYYYDKIICTLAALVCLKQWENKGLVGDGLIEKGTKYLNGALPFLGSHRHRTVGFEILFPSLFQEALGLQINLLRHDNVNKVLLLKEEKLRKWSFDTVFTRRSTLLHSIEGLPLHAINWDQVLSFQDKGGSFMTSPATTAFVYLHTRNRQCLEYLAGVLEKYGHIPVGYPLDIFETAWCLEIIARLELEACFQQAYNKKIDMLRAHWSNSKGISWSSVFDLPDLDDTAVVYYLLNRKSLSPNAAVFNNFYRDNSLFCFPGELDSSPTHLFHFLQAYNGNDGTLLNTARQQLGRLLNGEWTDKWHLSPYYLTSMAVEPLFHNVAKIITFVLRGQHPDGGWGMNGSNAEETAWACLTLLLYLPLKPGRDNSIDQCLRKGVDFLTAFKSAGTGNELPPLWIEKCLYTPYSIVHTLINAVILKFNMIKE